MAWKIPAKSRKQGAIPDTSAEGTMAGIAPCLSDEAGIFHAMTLIFIGYTLLLNKV